MAQVLAAPAADDRGDGRGRPGGRDDPRRGAGGDAGSVYVLDRGITHAEDLSVSVFRSGRPVPVHLAFATDRSAGPRERILMSVRACRLCYRICEVARGRMPARLLVGILDPADVRRLVNYARLLATGHVPLAASRLQDRLCPTWILRMHGLFQARGVCVFTGTVLIGEMRHIIVFTLGHAGCQWSASDLLVS